MHRDCFIHKVTGLLLYIFTLHPIIFGLYMNMYLYQFRRLYGISGGEMNENVEWNDKDGGKPKCSQG